MSNTVYYKTVDKLGEVIRFGEDKRIKASFKTSTSAVYNLANRAYYIEGQAFKVDYRVGDYFSRECEPKAVYMIATVVSEPLAPDLAYLYAMRCNAVITIMRYKGRESDEYGDTKDVFEEAFKDVPVYRDFTTRSGKQTNDGLIDQAIYTMILPHRFMLSEKDRVIMKTNIGGEYIDREYFVENIGNAVAEDDGCGVDTAQLSLDTRS